MGHTPEQRDQHVLCGARRRNGEPCRKFAGEGTDHLGTGCCKYHGGSTTSHRKAAVAVEATRRMVTLGEPIEDITAPTALLGLLSATAGHVEWLRGEIAGMGADLTTTHDGLVITRMYSEERDRLARIAEGCTRAGVADALIRMAEMQAETIVKWMRASMDELRLTPGQRKALGPAMRKIRPTLEGAEPDSSQDERIADALAEDYPQSEWIQPVG